MKNLIAAVLLAGASLAMAQQPVQIAKLNSDAQLTSVTICDHGRELIGIDKARNVHLFTLPVGTQRLVATGAEPGAMTACSPDGNIVALGTANGRITIIDTTKNSSAAPLVVSEHEFNSIDVSNQGLIAAAVADRSGILLRGKEKPIELPAEFGGPNGVAISTDGSLVAIADSDTKVRIYDASGHLKSSADVGPLEPFYLAFAQDAKEVYVSGADSRMRTIDVASGKVTHTSEKLGTAAMAMAMSPKRDEALVLMMDEYTMAPQAMAIWNAKTNVARRVDLDPKAYIGGGTGKNGWILVKQEEKALTLWEIK